MSEKETEAEDQNVWGGDSGICIYQAPHPLPSDSEANTNIYLFIYFMAHIILNSS